MLPLALALVIVVADQATKHVVRASFRLGESIPVIDGLLNWTYVRNTGAAWGLFGGYTTALTFLSLVVLAVMLLYRRSFLNDSLDHRIALGLMIGGIVGNFMDRFRQGWVTDMIDVYLGDAHWPCFNLADSAICVGVGIYLLSSLWGRRPPAAGTEEDGSGPPGAPAGHGS